MSQSTESVKTILIVDDDLGFLTWLGLTLSSHGFVTVPAIGASQACEAIKDLQLTIHLAILNFTIESIEEFVVTLRSENPDLGVIAIEANSGGTSKKQADASHSRAQAGWLTTVRRVLGLEKAKGQF